VGLPRVRCRQDPVFPRVDRFRKKRREAFPGSVGMGFSLKPLPRCHCGGAYRSSGCPHCGSTRIRSREYFSSYEYFVDHNWKEKSTKAVVATANAAPHLDVGHRKNAKKWSYHWPRENAREKNGRGGS
jgi:hypothetical protein